MEKSIGPINSIVLARAGESDKIYKKDQNSIELNGLCELMIKENQFMNFNDRADYLQELSDKLFGVEYHLNDFVSTGIMYYDLLDKYNIKIGNTTYSCLMLNDEQDITQGLEENIHTDRPETSETDYTKADTTDRKINQTYLIVDKQNQQIEAVISQTTEQNKKINRVTQTVDELNSKISDIADITISKESNEGFVEFEKVNQSEPIRLVIRPIAENISYLYPSDNLFPSDTLFPKSRTIRFENITNKTHVDYELPTNLLYYDNQNYDEFILDYDAQTCLVNKKVGYNADGTTYVLGTPLTLEYIYPQILLEDGDYKISVLGYSPAYIFARVMAQNIYTTQFATKAEVSSSINQTAQNINLSVDKKLTNYSTTTEMNSAINMTANEINSEVKKKVGNNEIISKINQSAESVGIEANKIKLSAEDVLNLLAGNTINLTSKNIVISSNAFNVDKYGNVTLKSSGARVFKVENANDSSKRVYITDEAVVVDSATDLDRASIGLINGSDGYISVVSSGNSVTEILGTGIKTPKLTQTSLESIKKNFEEVEDATNIVKNSDIYKYNFKTEEDTDKKHYGFVIGKNYNTPDEVISKTGDGIDTYSMCSILWKAVQEQQEQIELLQKEINKLKGEK